MNVNEEFIPCVVCNKLLNAETEAKPCTKCNRVYYCNRKHRKQDWPKHKKNCILKPEEIENNLTEQENDDEIENTDKGRKGSQSDNAEISVSDTTNNGQLNNSIQQLSITNTDTGCRQKVSDTSQKNPSASKSRKRNGLRNTQQPIDKDIQTNPDKTEASSDSKMLRHEETKSTNSTVTGPVRSTNPYMSYFWPRGVPPFCPYVIQPPKSASDENWAKHTANYLIPLLSTYGMCVLDNFVGEDLGNRVLDEAIKLYNDGAFVNGETVNKMKGMANSSGVRSDKVYWVKDGQSDTTKATRELMCHMNNLVLMSKQMRHQGELEKHNIKKRSNGMIACYPADGSCYIKHVDNPSSDGRCITAIYYMNKNWTASDGGVLRIYPVGSSQVADIEPKFDRVVFFWSDRRNPHEVQPAFRIRYALTLWFYDEGQGKTPSQATTQLAIQNSEPQSSNGIQR